LPAEGLPQVPPIVEGPVWAKTSSKDWTIFGKSSRPIAMVAAISAAPTSANNTPAINTSAAALPNTSLTTRPLADFAAPAIIVRSHHAAPRPLAHRRHVIGVQHHQRRSPAVACGDAATPSFSRKTKAGKQVVVDPALGLGASADEQYGPAGKPVTVAREGPATSRWLDLDVIVHPQGLRPSCALRSRAATALSEPDQLRAMIIVEP
jgi:hypothetical protein